MDRSSSVDCLPTQIQIDIQKLPKNSDEEMLLYAMGSEAANVHLGTKSHSKQVLKGLKSRKHDWLKDAAVLMANILEKNWQLSKNLSAPVAQNLAQHIEHVFLSVCLRKLFTQDVSLRQSSARSPRTYLLPRFVIEPCSTMAPSVRWQPSRTISDVSRTPIL